MAIAAHLLACCAAAAAAGTRISIDFGLSGNISSKGAAAASAATGGEHQPPLPPPPFDHFWRASGWCPPGNKSAAAIAAYALEESSWQNHALVAAVPNRGIEFMRVHDLLYLLEVQHGATAANLSAAQLRFGKLDAVLDLVVEEHGFTLGFELMGNPKVLSAPGGGSSGGGGDGGGDGDGDGKPHPATPGLFTDWTDAAQLASWRTMVGAIAARYAGRYGLATVRRWRWETWNEPDHQCNGTQMSAGITCTLDGWLGYFDACARGLMDAVPPSAAGAAAAATAAAAGHTVAADGSLLWGGPGTGGATLQTQFLEAMLKHVAAARARDAATGAAVPSTRLDFVQWHEKGVLPGACGPGKDSSTHVDVVISARALAAAPQLVSTGGPGGYAAALPLGNEEVDPKGGWSGIDAWRGDARYPAAAARVLAMHLAAVARNGSLPVRWGYHANDNAFLNYGDAWFAQRTLTVRFLMNATGAVEVLRKPIMSAMALLSLLGDAAVPPARVSAEGEGTGEDATDLSVPVGVIATTRGDGGEGQRWEAAALLYNSNGTFDCVSACNASVQLSLNGLPPATATAASAAAVPAPAPMLVEYAIDQANGNPAALWAQMGGASNPFPSAEQFAELRKAAELVVLRRTPLAAAETQQQRLQLQVDLPQPSLRLIHVCSPPAGGAPPAAVGGLRLRVTPTASPPTVFARWEDVPERCLETYEVMWRSSSSSSSSSSSVGGGVGGGSAAAPAQRVNELDSLFSAFTHAQQNATAGSKAAGCYSVRAVDYWGVAGALSDEVCL